MQLLTLEKGHGIEDRDNGQDDGRHDIQNSPGNADIHGNREAAVQKSAEQVALKKGDKVATFREFCEREVFLSRGFFCQQWVEKETHMGPRVGQHLVTNGISNKRIAPAMHLGPPLSVQVSLEKK